MIFQLYMTFSTISGSLGFPSYITLIDNIAYSGDVGDMTQDMTWHESAGTFMLLLECMSSYNVVGWWMSSWCITTSPPHGKLHGVFDGFWFAWWCLGMLLLSCMLEGLIDSFFHEWCMFVHSSICEQIFYVLSFICLWTYIFMIIYSWAHLFSCIVHSSIDEPLLVHVLRSFIPFNILLCLLVYLYLELLMKRWHQVQKFLVYHDTWSFRMKVTGRYNKVVKWDDGFEHC